MPTAIELTQLSKTYAKRGSPPLQAVADLNLTVPPGQVIGFLGPNGAGKTTTIKMICGLVEPTTGHAQLNGFDVRRQRSMAMRQVGAVLEGTRNIYWRLSAWQNLLYFGRLKGVGGRVLRQRAEGLLKELELWERRGDEVKEFSRGMQQKVAIACALIADPPIVLLDEPTLGLDVHAARTVKEWVKQLARTQGKTIVLTTHQLDMAEELCERVVIIRQGEMVVDEPTAKLLSLFQQEYYELRFDLADATLADQLATLPLVHPTVTGENGQTLLTGALAEDVTIYQLLAQLEGHQIPLLSVKRAQPNLEEVFVEVTRTKTEERP
ncbi:MAG TPA: ABC transporter ATP-binding protein [Caldilineaceae bacterium]|nr:ABC transporter ATP-binding protein [Caldilineaceae bacterium]